MLRNFGISEFVSAAQICALSPKVMHQHGFKESLQGLSAICAAIWDATQ